MSTEKTVTGVLVDVNATAGKLTIETSDGEQHLRFEDPRYQERGRAFRALVRLNGWVGRRVSAKAEKHHAFGWTVFGGRKIKLAPRAR